MDRDSAVWSRPGWRDSVGPLWFLRPSWSVGPRWRRAWARFFAGRAGVALQAHLKGNGYASAGFFVPAPLWGDLGYRDKENIVMGWIKDLRGTGGAGGPDRDASDPLWVSKFPALHEYLTVRARADGSPRRTASLTVFAEHGAWKCWLNERDSQCSLCASGSNVDDALSALEVMLESDCPPWRFSVLGLEGNGQKGRRKS